MKKINLILGSFFLFPLLALAKVRKVNDTLVQKINKTEIELVYNHYTQDGNNSAVTGGIGTEELNVYGPSLSIKKTFNKNVVALKMGADIVSSASTDNIDFVVSSASQTDTRYHANITYERSLVKQRLALYGGIGFSLESDYFSIGSKLGFVNENKSKSRTYSAELYVFNDDLRWGRLSKRKPPLKLIYPVELRDREWSNVYKRNSINLKLGVTQVLNKRNILGIYPEVTYQEGLLATPFHRVYFTDESERVEKLPNERLKFAVGFRLNTFMGGRVILKNTLNTYTDNFGVIALAVGNETAIKVTPSIILLPSIQFYIQKGADYFKPYGDHDKDARFYTSDYDLSYIETYNAGFGVKYKPDNYNSKKPKQSTLTIKYSYLHRSNNLSAHIVSCIYNIEFNHAAKKNYH